MEKAPQLNEVDGSEKLWPCDLASASFRVYRPRIQI